MKIVKDVFGRCAYVMCQEFKGHKPCCPHAAPVSEPRPTIRAPYTK